MNTTWSDHYRKLTEEAIAEAERLGVKNRARISPHRRVSDEEVEAVRSAIFNGFDLTLEKMVPSYWGVQCQNLATMIFAHLTLSGFDADIVIGEVDVMGNKEYDTTLEGIRKDYLSPDFNRPQNIHAWVSLGDDLIIDAGLSARLVKFYKMPKDRDPRIIIDRASWIAEGLHSKHQPLFIGTDFIAKTNAHDPLHLVGNLKIASDKIHHIKTHIQN